MSEVSSVQLSSADKVRAELLAYLSQTVIAPARRKRPDVIECGTIWAYRDGCRCTECRAVQAERYAARKAAGKIRTKYDCPCRVCGQMVQGSPLSLPEGQRICHGCRREARGRQRDERMPNGPWMCQRVECGAVFYGRGHGCEPPKFCSFECSKPKRKCEVCGSAYRPSYYEQRTCSRTCGTEINSRQQVRRRYPMSKIYVVNCKYCDVLFIARGSHMFICGDDECITANKVYLARRWAEKNPDKITDSAALRRAQVKATRTERISRKKVFDRDGWRCGICRKAVSKTRRHPDPLSASLDHVVPLAQGGEHTYANVRCSHLRCNVARHTGGGYEQLRLIG
jgi:predicted nucleic acid-binding Zn ribbon protein